MIFRNVFVTVGTTEFNKLIKTILQEDTIQALKRKGCKHLKIQFGAGEIIPFLDNDDISLECYRYKDSIAEDICEADLIISHAGAGTCMDVLERKKPLITVVNDDLMHNHQTELAEKLNEEGYSICCTCNSLVDAIADADCHDFKPFKYTYDDVCARYIEYLFHSSKNS